MAQLKLFNLVQASVQTNVYPQSLIRLHNIVCYYYENKGVE